MVENRVHDGQMNGDRHPERDDEGRFTRFVMQDSASQPTAWPPAQQVEHVQRSFGNPAAIRPARPLSTA